MEKVFAKSVGTLIFKDLRFSEHNTMVYGIGTFFFPVKVRPLLYLTRVVILRERLIFHG